MADWPYNTATWAKLRRVHLALEPMCRGCRKRGLLTVANTVDHVVPISDGGPAFPGHDGLASYCPACHSAKTARGAEAGAVRTTKPRRGCDVHGNPLDPEHSWSRKSLRAGRTGPPRDHQNQLVQKTRRKGER